MARSERRVHPIVYIDYRIRCVAVLLASICVATVFYERGASPLTWALLATWGLVWPHAAFLSAKHGRNTKNAEITNLLIDGAICGGWMAFLRFSPWTTVMFLCALTLGYLSVGGIGVWLAAGATLVVAATAVGATTGFAFDPTASALTTTAAIACLLLYAFAFGIVTNRQARRIVQSGKTIEQQNAVIDAALQRQTAIGDIARTISDSPTTAEPVLATITERIARLCDTVDVTVFQVDGAVLRRVASHGSLPRSSATASAGIPLTRGTVSGRAVVDRALVHVADMAAETDPGYADSRAYQGGLGIRSMLAVPMLREGTPLGVILLRRTELRPFDAREIELVQTFADQGAVALDNARLFEELQSRSRELARSLEEMRALNEVARVIGASLDLDEILQTVIRHAVTLSASDAAAITEFDLGARVFSLVSSHGLSDELVTTIRATPVDWRTQIVPRGTGGNEPWQIPDMAGASWYAFRDVMLREGFLAQMATVIPGSNRGIVVFRRVPGRFDPRLVDLIVALANQAKIAIDNARLFHAIEDKSRQIEAATLAKSRFLANMSHELRTPLNAILGYTELMIDGTYGAVPEKAHEILERIDKSGRHLLGLINDVLDLSKIEAGQVALALADYSMLDVVHSVVQAVEALAADKHLALRVSVPPDLPPARGDARRLMQVLLNLVGNAIKFTEAGAVTIEARREDALLHVAVADTGPGVAPADQQRIFEEFQQVDDSDTRTKSGTGLGLAIARRIVALHGGRLWLQSELGHGSVFRFTVPLRVEKQAEGM